MQEDMALYKYCRPTDDFIQQAFSFDVNKLEQVDDLFVSKCVIGLSQYLVYFKSQQNYIKIEIGKKQRFLEATLFYMITPEVIKEYKTKKDARAYMISSNAELNSIQTTIETLQDEHYLLEGLDKTISELIAAFKRELTRRENELYQRRRSA